SAAVQPPSRAKPTGTELATAFDGTLERRAFAPLYYVGLLLTIIGMLLLPVAYVALVAGVAFLTGLHAVYDVRMLSATYSPRALIVLFIAYAAPLFAGGLTVLFLVAPLVWRSKRNRPPRPTGVSRREEPMLYAYVDGL